MSPRWKRRSAVLLLVVAGLIALAAAQLPYVPFVHGTRAQEVERLAEWLEVRPGTRIADLGAGKGTYAVALARRVGPEGRVYATEVDDELLAGIRRSAAEAKLSNVEAIRGAVSSTRLPEGCCDALFSRLVYHHLTEARDINADVFRALRPGGRYLVIDFEPGSLLDWIAGSETAERHGGHGTPTETVLREAKAAGFQVLRGPEPWRGRTYAVLFERP
ncbi:methyltransferase type 11 [Sulfurifustis variabilis]|uniref:Methyltransferase type 11 n=1 Tax=Sulfurifustis variabilis TaxID=1675686 RepID=A0A1B4V9M5_9GAMM|nr:methyltransferase domain-containing protein [Sulfurifustis variabilis]BAU49372.1 methyltransferase type 11 [Sulfurifustis variabilis]